MLVDEVPCVQMRVYGGGDSGPHAVPGATSATRAGAGC